MPSYYAVGYRLAGIPEDALFKLSLILGVLIEHWIIFFLTSPVPTAFQDAKFI